MALVTKLYLQYDERLMYPILSYIQDTYVLMVIQQLLFGHLLRLKF